MHTREYQHMQSKNLYNWGMYKSIIIGIDEYSQRRKHQNRNVKQWQWMKSEANSLRKIKIINKHLSTIMTK